MHRYILIALVLGLTASLSFGQTGVVGSKHDLSAAVTTTDQVCVFCHTPHVNGTYDMLWNRTPTAASQFNYGKKNLTATSNLGTTMCLSCHDGITAVGELLNEPGSGTSNAWTAAYDSTAAAAAGITISSSGQVAGAVSAMGTDLSYEHPVGMDYSGAASDTVGFQTLASMQSALGVDHTTVECSTCHNPHDRTYSTFLRVDNAGSTLCISCHIK